MGRPRRRGCHGQLCRAHNGPGEYKRQDTGPARRPALGRRSPAAREPAARHLGTSAQRRAAQTGRCRAGDHPVAVGLAARRRLPRRERHADRRILSRGTAARHAAWAARPSPAGSAEWLHSTGCGCRSARADCAGPAAMPTPETCSAASRARFGFDRFSCRWGGRGHFGPAQLAAPCGVWRCLACPAGGRCRRAAGAGSRARVRSRTASWFAGAALPAAWERL
jgi:hypothetical protein